MMMDEVLLVMKQQQDALTELVEISVNIHRWKVLKLSIFIY
jgi:hypothetical protein